MRTLLVIGIGTGDPEHLTIQAIRALNRADVFFALDKGDAKGALVRFREHLCERYVEHRRYRWVHAPDPIRDPNVASYTARVEAWHEQRAAIYEGLFARELGEEQTGAILVWGDPSLYDSTLRILERVAARGGVRFRVEVIPGISSPQVLAARHRIALNRIGAPIHLTTGARLARGEADAHDDVLVMLDGECAFRQVADGDTEIFWGAYLGGPDELLISGTLAERAGEIERIRSEARQKHGWIMDTYLLRRPRRG